MVFKTFGSKMPSVEKQLWDSSFTCYDLRQCLDFAKWSEGWIHNSNAILCLIRILSFGSVLSHFSKVRRHHHIVNMKLPWGQPPGVQALVNEYILSVTTSQKIKPPNLHQWSTQVYPDHDIQEGRHFCRYVYSPIFTCIHLECFCKLHRSFKWCHVSCPVCS